MPSKTSTEPPEQNIYQAALWMAAWIAALSIMAIAGRQLSTEISAFQTQFFRSSISLLLVVSVWIAIGRPSLATSRLRMHVGRNFVHYGAQFLWFLAIGLLPLALVISIEFTTPVWTALLAALFLGEKLTPLRILAIALGFGGVLLIVRPGLEPISIGMIAILVAAIGFGFSLIMTKTLASTDSAFVLIFYMHLTQFLISVVPTAIVLAVPSWEAIPFMESVSPFVWTTPSANLLPWAVAVGLAGAVSHYFLTRALALADATVVVPLDFIRLPLMMLAGYALYSESLDVLVFAGAAMILAGNFVNVRSEGRKSRQNTPVET